jgi:hypothetical protein
MTIRNANSDQQSHAKPQSAEPTAYRAMLSTMAGRRLKRSPSAPIAMPPDQRKMKAAGTRVAAVTVERRNSCEISVSTRVMRTKSTELRVGHAPLHGRWDEGCRL